MQNNKERQLIVPMESWCLEAELFADRRIAKAIVTSGALKIGDFLFSSSEKAEMKIIVEELLKNKKYTGLVLDGFIKTIEINKMRFNKICGVIEGGAKLAKLLSERLGNFPVIERMGKNQSEEKQTQVFGEFEEGDELLYVDDVVTSGENVEICVRQARKEGALGTKLLALSTYDTKVSLLRFKKLGIVPHFLTNVGVILESAKGLGTISEKKFEELIRWRNQLDENLLASYK